MYGLWSGYKYSIIEKYYGNILWIIMLFSVLIVTFVIISKNILSLIPILEKIRLQTPTV